MRVVKLVLLLAPIIGSASLSEGTSVEPLSVGNFSLPSSQQPSPLVSFGQNIIDKDVAQLFFFADAFIGKDNYWADVIPGFLYGIRDDFSLFFNVPFAPGIQQGREHSSGIEDLFVQLEYAFCSLSYPRSQIQATVVGNATFPTGSIAKSPPTGMGSFSFFTGATCSYTTDTWLAFVSPGAVFVTTHSGTKMGNQFLYQAGFGRNIATLKGWIFAWLVEFDGLYAKKNQVQHHRNPNSGGNTIYVTPSIWISSTTITIQVGVGSMVST